MTTQQEVVKPKDLAIETALLKAMSKRENFGMYYAYVDHRRVLPNTSVMLKAYDKYFNLYQDSNEIDFDQLFTHFANEWHAKDLDEQDIEYYRDYVIPAIKKNEAEDIEASLLGLLQKQTLTELNEKAEKEFDLDNIRYLLDKYENKRNNILKESDKEAFTIDNIDFNVLDKAEGIPYFLPSLQAGLGSLVKGQFVIVSADYGAGKSAFVISQAAEAFKNISDREDKGPVLYFNSEGTEADVYARFLSNIYKEKVRGGFEHVLKGIDKIKQHFTKTFNPNKFMVFQIAGNNIHFIRQKMEKYKPSLVVIDICDVLAKEEDVTTLKKLYDDLRLLSGAYCPIIGTSQSGDTSYLDKEEGKVKNIKWLGDKALYGSKTGKGGAADTIITIGKDEDVPHLRYVSTPKKKRGQPVNITCEIEDIYSNYKELQW